jgi:hypothetical protein
MRRLKVCNRGAQNGTSFLLAYLILMSFLGRAVSGEVNSKYLYEKEPRRLALIIGNAKYEREHIPPLPGSRVDIDEIEKRLKNLHFQIVRVDDVQTTADYEELYHKPFLRTIQPGDLVLFYYSGHGFSYNGASYIVPTKFQLGSVAPEDRFISVDSIRRTITSHEPGILVTILDSCRNNLDLSSYLDAAVGASVSKGFPAIENSSNEIINYAAAPNSSAEGSKEAKASLYTGALVEFLSVPGLEWGDIVREVYIEVKLRSKDHQFPWRSDANGEFLYLAPTESLKADFKEAWVSTLRKGTAEEVRRFAEKYALTPYGMAARQWLAENNKVEVRNFTRVSPVLVDRAWNDKSLEVKVTKLTGPIGFGRSLAPSKTASGPAINSTDSLADILLGTGEIVVLANLNARVEPQSEAKIVKTYRFGSRLPILDYVYERGGKIAWFKVHDVELSLDLYVRALAHVGQSSLDLGEPLKQFFVGARPQSLPTLVDDKAIVEQIQNLRRSKYSISWTSIAIPKSADPFKELLHSAWAANAVYILTKSGIPKGHITSISDASLASEKLRIRVFGNSRSNKKK